MEILDSLAHLAGRLLRPLRSDESRLASRRLDPQLCTLEVQSHSFTSGAVIPAAHNGDDGRSPELSWSKLPPATQELALVCEDSDAPLRKPYVQWLVYGIEPDTHLLHEGLPPTGAPLYDGAQQGRNSTGDHGYTGPRPPPGHGLHHYHFQVFALDEPLELRAPVDRDDVVSAMRGHVLAWGETIGTCER